MKKLFTIIALLSFVVGFSSCNDKWEPGDEPDAQGTGSLALKKMSVDVIEPDGTDARASYVLDDYIISIYNKTTGALTGSTYVYKSMPDIITLPVGEYRVEVKSGDVAKAAFDAPYFVGSQEFTITDGEITEIETVTCTLANIKVTIRYTDRLTAAASADSKVSVVANDEGRLDFGLTETRSGFFQALEGSSTLVASFTGTINGYAENNIRRIYKDVKPGDHYIITFDLAENPGMDDEYGNVDIDGVQLDVTVEIENVDSNINIDEDQMGSDDRPGKEDPKEPDNPTPPTPGDDAITFETELDTDGGIMQAADYGDGKKEAVVVFNTTDGATIDQLHVHIDSPYLTLVFMSGINFTTDFDVANPGEYAETLDGFSLDNGPKVKGQTTATFNITNLVPLLGLDPTDGDIHTFVITLVDSKGRSLTINLKFESHKQ